jgi:serine/threonine protein kinase
MNDNLIKSGACSLLLGSKHYEGFFPYKKNKLLKLSKISHKHNELTYLNKIREIKEYDKYYTIPDKEILKLLPNSNFTKYLINIIEEDEINIISSKMNCMYITYAGDIDLLDSINLLLGGKKSVWSSAKSILKFSHHIIKGLAYLHEKKICHLDIKPENIMINTTTNTFTIIDFGFASIEPFDDFVNSLKGTPGYFPKNLTDNKYIEPGLPEIKANDIIFINYQLPMRKDRTLVYKIDSYCFGRVLNQLYYYYQELTITDCFCYEYKTKSKISKLINILTEDDVFKRKTISEVLKNSVF